MEVPMIRVSVVYLQTAGGRFDMAYYRDKHMPLVKGRLERFGLSGAEVDQPISGVASTPSPFAGACHLYFDALSGFQQGLQTHGAEILADLPNFTNIQPYIQISEIFPV